MPPPSQPNGIKRPMSDPAFALLTFTGLTVLCGVLLWPVHGVAARIRRLASLTERVRLEDVLKQLHKLEYDQLPATAESVAGGVQSSRHQAIRILQSLEERDFVTTCDTRFRLTEAGRAYALRVVRTHRLWERFLADRTGTPPEEWHGRAETREHTLSPSDAEELAAALGHPAYDPHGDPIPTVDGRVPARSGVPLSSLRQGDHAVVTHLEDEPAPIFGELVALGLGIRTSVERLESPAGRVRFRADGREHDVSAAVARNVTVEPARASVAPTSWSRTLADVRPGDSAVVVGISHACRGPARRRLLDLGVVPGTLVRAELRSAAGDPVAYDVRGALIALRREQAVLVGVEAASEAGAARVRGAQS